MKQYLLTLVSILVLSSGSLFAQAPEQPSVSPVLPKYKMLETPKGPTSTMEFETTEYDFGIIDQGEKARYVYKFRNTSDIPLIITNAKGSCGCTVPSWPKEPVLPGESGTIEVEFNSKGKKGKQSKRVTITANTNPAQTFLTIKGEINVPAQAEGTQEKIVETKPEPLKPIFKEGVDYKPSDCFAIYPNPTAEVLNLDFKEHEGQKAEVHIYSQSGKLMALKVIDSITSSAITFDVSAYTQGMYFARIQIDQEQPSTKCFIVAKK